MTKTYHDTRADCYSSATVRVRDYVSKPNTQERDGDEPHGVEEVGMIFVVKPEDREWR